MVEDDRCQIASMNEGIVPEDLEIRGEQVQEEFGLVTPDHGTARYSIKRFVKKANDFDLMNMTLAMMMACEGKTLEVVKEEEVDERTFTAMKEGKYVESSSIERKDPHRSKRAASGCKSQKVKNHKCNYLM